MKPIILKGKHGTAKIYAKTIEDELLNQCKELLDQEMTANSHIAIMPDAHVGKGCMIGTTMEIQDEICPNIVGVDLSCSMLTVNIGHVDIDFEKLDDIITKYVPLGFNSHKTVTAPAKEFFKKHKTVAEINLDVPKKSIGTLGGGNHFIEIDVDENTGEKYLVIHTGSRNFGKQIAEYWQERAIDKMAEANFVDTKAIIAKLTGEGKERDINSAVKKIKKENEKLKRNLHGKDLATLSGEDMEGYLHDIKIAEKYARLNRQVIADTILFHLFDRTLDDFEHFETMHNYIDLENMILRKGAISAKKGEKVLIPLNMRDGCLIAIGKGNKEWNFSAPHGAGRIMSRREARQNVNLVEFKETMKGIHSSSIGKRTLDEAPFVYKDTDEIKESITDTVNIVKHIRPIYNRKAE